jgi:NAD+ synthase
MSQTDSRVAFSAAVLQLDPAEATGQIVEAVCDQVLHQLRRRGVVVAVSGGIDSSVVAASCAHALGPERVLALLMPERDSSPDSLHLGRMLAERFGITAVREDISGILEAAGCYRRRDEAIGSVFADYGPGCKAKIVLPPLLERNAYRIFSVVIQTPGGQTHRRRLPPQAYQTVVAATNFKQRVRKMMEYYHADRLRYAVAGTPNRLEHELGFFVKNGDGSADLKPIAHLYKTQVYQLAEYLGVPEDVHRRPPTTDTYSLEQSQEEFFFSLPYDKMDLCLYGKDHHLPCGEVGEAIGLTAEQVDWVYRDIDAKRAAAHYLRERPLLVESD